LDSEVLAVRDLHAFYGGSHVLHGLDLRLRKGELLALLGRNGAGKTTLISAITGLGVRRTGTIELNGLDVSRADPEQIAKMGIGLVPQGRHVFSSLTVRENLVIAARVPSGQKTPWTLERAFKTFPRLQERHNQNAGALSGGEQQLLVIARALLTNPSVLLLDEPSEGLAPQMVDEVQRIVRDVKNEGTSIVLVEQNIRFALALADRVAILNTGRLVFAGSPEDLRTDNSLIDAHLGVH
jgi:branched-chain amino acid transport system ATP-binding protein